MKTNSRRLLLAILLLVFGVQGADSLYADTVVSVPRAGEADQPSGTGAVSDRDIHALVQTVLEAMLAAYETEAPERFMVHVSENFAGGDKLVLESAVRRDFSLFDNIELQGSISGIATSPQGYVAVTLAYSRFVISARSGKPLHDRGLTELVFEIAGDAPKVYSMKNPLLFGVSNARAVATGTVSAGPDSEILVVTDSGEAAVKPFQKALDGIHNLHPETPAADSLPTGPPAP